MLMNSIVPCLQDIFPIESDFGLRMDGAFGQGQSLRCSAASGCWYTVFYKENGVDIDGSCAPKAVIASTRNAAIELSQRNDLKPFAAGDDDVNDGTVEGGAVGSPPMINKKCHYVPRGSLIEHACLYYSPDPIDALTITWQVNGGGSNFGVDIVTEFPYISRKREREIYGAFRSRDNDGASIVEKMKLQLANFKLSTAGGGKG